MKFYEVKKKKLMVLYSGQKMIYRHHEFIIESIFARMFITYKPEIQKFILPKIHVGAQQVDGDV